MGTMPGKISSGLRALLPWAISAGLLAYAFGWATDWQRLVEATERADLPWFIAFATCDRLAFFVIWTLLSAAALRRFVMPVPVRSVFAVRGGSELGRVVSNPLADGAFLVGILQLAGGRMEAIVAAAFVPAIAHLSVMLLQMTVALPFLDGGPALNRDVYVAAALLWAAAGALVVFANRLRRGEPRTGALEPVQRWLQRFPPRTLLPFIAGFGVLAVFDVQIQWLASRAFGVPIEWTALLARLPLVYFSFTIPPLGNFGTREVAWATLFSDFGEQDALIAYAFSVNAIFLILNGLLGMLFLRRALALIREVRETRRTGGKLPHPFFPDPTDP